MTKVKKDKKNISQKHTFDPKFPFLFSTIATVFLIYVFSLFRQWLAFDERVFYSESLFPIPEQFDEITEIIKSFVLNYHTESMNTFFSNLMTIRANTLASMFIVLVSFFFKKNAFLYHLLQSTIHLINTLLIWLIFYKVTKFFKEISLNNTTYLIISILTLMWGLHSANTEAVLLVTNWDTILTYTFCLGLILYELNLISINKFQKPRYKSIIIAVLFSLIMFYTEYAYTLPLCILFLAFAFIYKVVQNAKQAGLYSFNIALPYFIGLFIYVVLSLVKPDSSIVNLIDSFTHPINTSSNTSIFYLFFERILWLVPQIFIQFIKLLLFPKTLSLYQSTHIHLANALFEPYSLFCIFFYLLFLVLPLFIFFSRYLQPYKFICSLFYAFYSLLIPFLHIILPTYCLSADRYCYFPSFLLMLISLCIIFSLYSFMAPKHIKQLITILSGILLILSMRTLIRIQDWNQSYTLYKSAIRIDKNPLYKGEKLIIFADYVGSLGKQKEMEDSLEESLKELHKALKQLKQLKHKYKEQPITLRYYGLDLDSLILKAAYAIATVKNDNYQESAKDILKFFEPYIENKIRFASINAIDLYSEILIKAGEIKKAEKVLKEGIKLYPYSSALIHGLIDFYFGVEKDLNKAHKMLQKAYKYFPNDTATLGKLIKYYEAVNDKENLAKFYYLLGLRIHSEEYYQKAAIIYLDYNQLPKAHLTLKKLARLNSNNPLTLLLSGRYLDLTGNKEKVPELLANAYLISKSQGNKENISVTKSILVSLINIYFQKGDILKAKQYLSTFQNMKNLNPEDLKQLALIKDKLKS